MCAIHTGIVNRLLENNQPDGARRYLDGVESNLPANTRDKLDQFICTGENRQQALNAVQQAQAKSEDHAEQRKALDGMRDNGKIDEAVHAIASHSLQAAQQQQLTVQKQNDEQSLARVWGLKQNNPNAALTDIPASTLAYLKSRGLDKNAEAILSGHPATDDPALFNQLHRLASADPVKFAQTSLITHSGDLSKSHMDYLQSLQDAINKQDPQAIAANTQVNDAVHTVQQEMKLTGIDLNPEAGRDREKQLAQAESGLRDRIIAAQQAKNGIPLSSDEVQNLAMGYFADQVLKGGVAGKGGDEEQLQAYDNTQSAQIMTDGHTFAQSPQRESAVPASGPEATKQTSPENASPSGNSAAPLSPAGKHGGMAANKKQLGGTKSADDHLYSPGVQETLTQHSQDVVSLLRQMSGMDFKVTSGRQDMPGQVRAMVNYPFAQGKADGTYKKNPTALKLYAWYKGMHKGGLSDKQISDVFINVLSLDKKLGAQFAASMPHMAGSPDTYQAIDIGPQSIDQKRWVEFKDILNQLHEAGVLRKPPLVPAEIADKRNEKDSSFHFEVNQHLTPEQQRAYGQLNIDTYLK